MLGPILHPYKKRFYSFKRYFLENLSLVCLDELQSFAYHLAGRIGWNEF